MLRVEVQSFFLKPLFLLTGFGLPAELSRSRNFNSEVHEVRSQMPQLPFFQQLIQSAYVHRIYTLCQFEFQESNESGIGADAGEHGELLAVMDAERFRTIRSVFCDNVCRDNGRKKMVVDGAAKVDPQACLRR